MRLCALLEERETSSSHSLYIGLFSSAMFISGTGFWYHFPGHMSWALGWVQIGDLNLPKSKIDSNIRGTIKWQCSLMQLPMMLEIHYLNLRNWVTFHFQTSFKDTIFSQSIHLASNIFCSRAVILLKTLSLYRPFTYYLMKMIIEKKSNFLQPIVDFQKETKTVLTSLADIRWYVMLYIWIFLDRQMVHILWHW